MVSPDVVGIGSEYFVVYLLCVHIYVRLIMSGYPFFCIYFVVYHMLSKIRSSGITYRVIGEVLVLDLLVVVYKIPYSSCM